MLFAAQEGKREGKKASGMGEALFTYICALVCDAATFGRGGGGVERLVFNNSVPGREYLLGVELH